MVSRLIPLFVCSPAVFAGGIMFAAELADETEAVLFSEGFDDDRLLQRGWYDGRQFKISDEAFAGSGCIEYHWQRDTTSPDSSSGVRHLFEPTDTAYLRFYIKLSKDWGWTGRSYHPHLMHFMTTENGRYHGPAASHLTLYIEPQNGKLRLAAQDIQNKDAPHGLTQGLLRGGYNGKFYDSKEALFADDKWHSVEAMFKLNTLDLHRDKPNPDGIVRGWFDGELVVDRTDVIFRSTDFPKMKFNQFLLTPYFGPGLLPHEQTLWIDELAIGTKRIGPVESKDSAPGGSTNGDRASARRNHLDGCATEKISLGNWRQFRGPNRDNISPEIGLLKRWPVGGPLLMWKASGLGSGFSSVSVVDGRIYTQGHIGGEELVFALDEATGRRLWSVPLGPAERVAYPGSRSTPTVDGELLYMETVAGDVVCLDARSRRIVWRKHLKRDFGGRPGNWGYAESPLVDGVRVIITPGGKQTALAALDKHAGRVVWKASVPDDDHDNWKHSRDPYADPNVAAYSSVIVAEVGGVRQYVQFLQQGVVGIRADGKFLWREDSSSCEYANCPTPIFHNGYVFSASGWQGAALIRPITEDGAVSARLVYANNAMRNWYGGFFLHDGHVYGCSNEILTCMNFLTGEVAWKNRSVGMGSVVYADGHFVMRGDGGTVALVEATSEDYREKGRFDQPDRSDRPARSYPVVTGGRLYLRDEGVLLCYDLWGQ